MLTRVPASPPRRAVHAGGGSRRGGRVRVHKAAGFEAGGLRQEALRRVVRGRGAQVRAAGRRGQHLAPERPPRIALSGPSVELERGVGSATRRSHRVPPPDRYAPGWYGYIIFFARAGRGRAEPSPRALPPTSPGLGGSAQSIYAGGLKGRPLAPLTAWGTVSRGQSPCASCGPSWLSRSACGSRAWPPSRAARRPRRPGPWPPA